MLRMIIGLAAVSAAGLCAEDTFEYRVFRDHLPKKELGQLRISEAGITYRSDNGKTAIQLPLIDVLTGDVSDPKVIRIEVYDRVKRRLSGRQIHRFQLREGVHGEGLAAFLSKALQRPVVGAFELRSKPFTQLHAYHRHRIGGCHGVLHFDQEGIRFISEHLGDSRTWRYQEVETVGTMNRFHCRVSTLAETFNFDLQERLSDATYDLVTRRVYSLPSTSLVTSKE